MPHIFISPHFDDICFSLAGFIQTLNKDDEKIIINIFTKSNYIRRMKLENLNFNMKINLVSEIRRNEDLNFCKKYKIKQVNLDFFESSLQNEFKQEIETIKNSLSININNIIKNSNNKQINIYFPLGVGNHKDHILTFTLGKNLMTEFPKLKFYFYCDLPYSHKYKDFKNKLNELNSFLKENNLQQVVYKLSFKQIINKLKAILFYESQHIYLSFRKVKILRYFVKNNRFFNLPKEILFIK